MKVWACKACDQVLLVGPESAATDPDEYLAKVAGHACSVEEG